jgi:hypothetical protein
MAYVRERQLADFAKSADLPVILDSCPACFSMPGERAYIGETNLDVFTHNLLGLAIA